MQIITKEEAEKFTVRKGRQSLLTAKLKQMKPGEILHLTRSDVPVKRGPFENVRRVSRTNGPRFKISTIINHGGWLVERTK